MIIGRIKGIDMVLFMSKGWIQFQLRKLNLYLKSLLFSWLVLFHNLLYELFSTVLFTILIIFIFIYFFILSFLYVILLHFNHLLFRGKNHMHFTCDYVFHIILWIWSDVKNTLKVNFTMWSCRVNNELLNINNYYEKIATQKKTCNKS